MIMLLNVWPISPLFIQFLIVSRNVLSYTISISATKCTHFLCLLWFLYLAGYWIVNSNWNWEKERMEKEEYSSKIKAVITSIKSFPNFRGWEHWARGREGCLWHIAAYSQNSFMYFYFIFKKKEHIKGKYLRRNNAT